MKAAVITRYGGPEVLQIRDVPDPQPNPGQVLVRVEAAGVNFADIMAARGGYPGTPEPPLVAAGAETKPGGEPSSQRRTVCSRRQARRDMRRESHAGFRSTARELPRDGRAGAHLPGA